jgi:SHS2 domain-containing protein
MSEGELLETLQNVRIALFDTIDAVERLQSEQRAYLEAQVRQLDEALAHLESARPTGRN